MLNRLVLLLCYWVVVKLSFLNYVVRCLMIVCVGLLVGVTSVVVRFRTVLAVLLCA